jgi:hypothetical protein
MRAQAIVRAFRAGSSDLPTAYSLDLANKTSGLGVSRVEIFNVRPFREHTLNHHIDVPIANQLCKHHPLVRTVTDQRKRKIHPVRLDLGRESMDISVLVNVGGVEEYGSRLIERVGDLERRMSRENPAIDARLKRLKRNSARPVAVGGLFDDVVSEVVTTRGSDPSGVFL